MFYIRTIKIKIESKYENKLEVTNTVYMWNHSVPEKFILLVLKFLHWLLELDLL